MKFNKITTLIPLLISTISLLFPISKLYAEEYKKGMYTSVGLGIMDYSGIILNDPSDYPHESGFNYEGNIGYDFGKKYRIEIGFNSATSKIESGSHAFFRSIMLNGYIDFPIENKRWEPFLGIGIGTTNVNAKNLCYSAGNCVDDVITVGINGGINYALTKSIDLTSKVSYLKFDDMTFTDNGPTYLSNTAVIYNANNTSNVIGNLGLKFKF